MFKPTDFFWALFNFHGYGDPQSRVWFVGIEDGGSGWTHEQLVSAVPDAYADKAYGPVSKCQVWKDMHPVDDRTGQRNFKKGTKIYRYMSYLLSGGKEPQTVKLILDTLTPGGSGAYFQMNLFPLGKPGVRAPWPNNYEEDFGIGSEDIDSYKDMVRQQRFPAMRALWDKFRPELTIAFCGEERREDVEEFFGIRFPEAKGKVRIHRGPSVVLTPFFGQGCRYDWLKPVLPLVADLD